ncbi:hypothetical protein QAD02_012920 [Eretmocerus hayati]|uniref:Uncharacterized protein n=1 Tax=Eretmocerus hayati TaxID=131215 RepID=A0ACC2P210_9HYME|nr:hypothetical protein QAD02_012920 [Eretmocerus hayati]
MERVNVIAKCSTIIVVKGMMKTGRVNDEVDMESDTEENEDEPATSSNGMIDSNELLIREVRDREPLWSFTDKNLRAQRGSSDKTQLWGEVHEAVKDHFPNVTAVKDRKKFNNDFQQETQRS